MDEPNRNAERREFHRTTLELPVEYQSQTISHLKGGLAVNVSEGGLLIHLVNDLPVGTILNVGVLFPKEFELSRVETTAQIVWKEIYWGEHWVGYEYGLKFVETNESELSKLKVILSDGFQVDQPLGEVLEKC
jgi:PilZ domain